MYDDKCYECKAYGDDYYLDGEGNWVSACTDCPYNDLIDWEERD